MLYVYSQETKYIMPALRQLGSENGKGVVVVGVTAKASVNMSLNGQLVPFVAMNEIMAGTVDIILVCGMGYHANYVSLSRELGNIAALKELPIIPDRVVCFKGFSLEKHLALKESKLSIISLQCFGCLVSHLLTLPFLSPFVNLYSKEVPFLEMLENDPREKLQGELIFRGME